jgi:thiol-disulfide isomerase/thioredoxin
MLTARTARRGRFWGRALLTGCLLSGAGLGAAQGAPPVAKMLEFRPRQEGVVCANPTADEQKDCKVDLVKGRGRDSGWVLKDGAGNVLRQFYDTNGDNRIDVWSYYKDGVEVYREVDTTFSGKADQYRWLNSGGSKWGIDSDRDGHIDTWKVISPEEVSQEAMRALVKRDLHRLTALMITDAEVKELGLSAEQAEQIKELRKGAKAKFEATAAKLTKLNAKSVWLHLETGAPQCVPGAGGRDVIKHARGTVLVDVGGGNEWFQTGPMIQVGAAWRLIDAPAPGAASEEPGKGGSSTKLDIAQDPKLQKLVEELTNHDKQPAPSGAAGLHHHLARADLLEKIVALVKPTERDPWIRQVADSLASAVQAGNGDATATRRLGLLEEQLVKAMPGSNLTAYVVFRRMQADYSVKIGTPKVDFNKVQQEWLDKLARFVAAYPKADDAPDALLQLGLVNEFLGKEVEAKNWYGQVVKNFSGKPQAVKAAGSLERLGLEGKPMRLAGPLLSDGNTAFDIDQLKGKFVVVYYYASWNGQCAADFKKLDALLKDNKDVAVLCVNLDSSIAEARDFLSRTPGPGTHIYQSGGLEGKLATQYGVQVLPSLFLVGKDGKCLSRSVQIGSLEDEIKKAKK